MNRDARPELMGIEMEMAVADALTGASHLVQGYFDALAGIKRARGQCEPYWVGTSCAGLRTPVADCGLDNGFNLLETALAPVTTLDELARRAHQELADSVDALAVEGACILNASEHPACPVDTAWYDRACVPRPIYRELRGHRGWRHHEGIDAKAQNGANTGVAVMTAVQALNVMIGLAPAFMALFANSPLEAGRETGLKENRMTLWPRVFGPAHFAGDLFLATFPARPFRDLADFFNWMFGPHTVSRGLPINDASDYKNAPTVLLDGNPSLSQFLHAPSWSGQLSPSVSDAGAARAVLIRPGAHHFEYSQIGQFLDARLRYRWARTPDLGELLRAWKQEGELEALFEACGAATYIEGRVPGAGFADAVVLREAGPEAALSMLIGPTALQRGLLSNIGQAQALLDAWGWQTLNALRCPAMRAALDDTQVAALCADVVAVARDGLPAADRRWLVCVEYMLDTRRTGADRLLATWRSTSGDTRARLAAVAREHAALHPSAYGGV